MTKDKLYKIALEKVGQKHANHLFDYRNIYAEVVPKMDLYEQIVLDGAIKSLCSQTMKGIAEESAKEIIVQLGFLLAEYGELNEQQE